MNPYRAAEKVGAFAFRIFIGGVVIGGLALVAYLLAVVEGWGWWTLLAIPTLVLLAIIVGCLRIGSDWIADRWRMAKWKWDAARASREEGKE